ncbi:uncharacterized protein LOC100488775 isoform X1 [Xenopus tropicalis]|uniref:Uncharacterized protein LOC100488775 isoform X1 n=2 Tax=Xenopus tropicalis TaxID=8364 RepID=A0A8J1JPF7_XENTR|nr:uncharacterized protein LOC100488775 isoform X1 [Xenopus tropicalis]XP_031758496.1 uncharacterized protein LOC100488775 isoform X1 [Xenopus tropicalis]|eukprot:XP_012826820.1 PREDICTED: uncharacterized protein LOC100488775 [Xenopus tropicalis]
MPEKKDKKKGKKGHKQLDTSILKRFLKTYESHCAESQSLASPTITQALKKSIQNGRRYVKVLLTSPEKLSEDSRPVYLKPLLMTIRDVRYMAGTDLGVWGIPLSNEDVASLAILLELSGRTSYPFSRLDLINCRIDTWSMERLGRAIRCSQLTSLSLDYNEFQDDGIQGLVQCLEANKRLVSLSLCYCNLGPESGAVLGKVLAETAISELYLNGNHLQCSGAVDLITTIAEHCKALATEELPEVPTSLAHQFLEAAYDNVGVHTAISEQPANMGRREDVAKKTTVRRKSKRKGSKKKSKRLVVPGPWVSKLHLADNGIDAMGKEGKIGVLEFSQLLSCLIRCSKQLSELNIDNNCLGEMAANDILEALADRNKAKLPRLKINVTAQIPSDTFKAISTNSGKLKLSKKKKKRK